MIFDNALISLESLDINQSAREKQIKWQSEKNECL